MEQKLYRIRLNSGATLIATEDEAGNLLRFGCISRMEVLCEEQARQYRGRQLQPSTAAGTPYLTK